MRWNTSIRSIRSISRRSSMRSSISMEDRLVLCIRGMQGVMVEARIMVIIITIIGMVREVEAGAVDLMKVAIKGT